MVFHAGTVSNDGVLQTSGGRVLRLRPWATRSNSLTVGPMKMPLKGIHFDGAQYRRDIGYRAIKR